jgi:hypothetical protein
MIELGTITVARGQYYEVASCDEKEIDEVVEDERLRKIVKDHCRTRGKSVEVLKFIILKDRDGNIVRIWSIELYYGAFGVSIFVDNP